MVAMSCAVIPVLIYEDIEAAQDHLVRVFGFTSDGVERTPDGAVVHGEVRLGQAGSGCTGSAATWRRRGG